MNYDVAVIGGGPGGYVAAIRAAQLGAKVLLIEKAQLGGVCLNRGCIPTKTLLKSAEKWRDLKHCSEFGLFADNISFTYQGVTTRMQQVVAQMKKGVEQLVTSNRISLIAGTARLTAPNQIRVTTPLETLQCFAEKIILATGSLPLELPIPGKELTGVMNSDKLLELTELPKDLVIIGAGAVGIEFASIFQTFGSNVTVIDRLPTILPTVDQDIVKRLALLLRKQGIKLLTNRAVSKITAGTSCLLVEVSDGVTTRQIEADKILTSIGRTPVVSELGLAELGIEYDQKGIYVDEKMETSRKGIYAIGDVTGKYMWAHAASAAGLIAGENVCGKNLSIDYKAVPSCIYLTPEVAMVGITEEQASVQGRPYKISKFNFAANGKAVSMGEPDGLVKIIADPVNDKLLGMHIFGAHASDLIMEGVLAIQNSLPVSAIAHTIHPHPSLSETIMECAHGIHGPSVHQITKTPLSI